MRTTGLTRRGFSLMELMTVCGILATLAGSLAVVYGSFGPRSRTVLQSRERWVVGAALNAHARTTGAYPAQFEDMLTSGVVCRAPAGQAAPWVDLAKGRSPALTEARVRLVERSEP